MRRLTLTIAVLCALTVAGVAQQPSLPRFAVASVKPVPPTLGDTIVSRPGAFEPGGRFEARNATLRIILHRAYPEFARPELLIAPEWIANERFDIDGRAATDAPIQQIRLMLRQLLIDRFRMQSHTEMRLVDTYDLVLARRDGRLGPRMRPASGACKEWNAQLAATGTEPEQPKQADGAIPCGARFGYANGLRTLSFGGREAFGLTVLLMSTVGRTITDRTGLTGMFDFELSWADVPLNDAQDTRPSLTNALEDQLGLKLQPAKGMSEVLVVDRIERPTPN
jgi:uncharacterized protein (TIGR03435 family)